MTHAEYLEYLQSQRWIWLSRMVKERENYTCEKCGRNDLPVEAHHVTYHRLGHEQPEDLMVLCRKCHRKLHAMLAEARARASQQGWLPFEPVVPSGRKLN